MYNLLNHMLRFDPLISGIGVFNPACGVAGTLGLLVTDGFGVVWMLSAYHVLGRAPGAGAAADREPVYQPFGPMPGESAVAEIDTARSSALDDYAMARLVSGAVAKALILGIGAPTAQVPPTVGMSVLKSGVRTGVTQGVITAVNAGVVTIEPAPGFPGSYELTSQSDSGSVWVEATSRAPVALHQRGQPGSPTRAYGLAVAGILGTHGLSALV